LHPHVLGVDLWRPKSVRKRLASTIRDAASISKTPRIYYPGRRIYYENTSHLLSGTPKPPRIYYPGRRIYYETTSHLLSGTPHLLRNHLASTMRDAASITKPPRIHYSGRRIYYETASHLLSRTPHVRSNLDCVSTFHSTPTSSLCNCSGSGSVGDGTRSQTSFSSRVLRFPSRAHDRGCSRDSHDQNPSSTGVASSACGGRWGRVVSSPVVGGHWHGHAECQAEDPRSTRAVRSGRRSEG